MCFSNQKYGIISNRQLNKALSEGVGRTRRELTNDAGYDSIEG